jgi:hypothetical protein
MPAPFDVTISQDSEAQMKRKTAICKLHEIVDYHLLSPGDWPVSGESLSAFCRTIRDLGLNEDVQDGRGTTKATRLGNEVSVDLMTVFAGCHEICEITSILADHGYIDMDEEEELELWTRPLSEIEWIIRFLTKRAYLDFCGRSRWLN